MDYNTLLLKYNLQFFAKDEGGEKTEEPTAKKIEDSRKEGQVAKSKELSSACSLLAIFVCLKIFMSFLGKRMTGVFFSYWNRMSDYVLVGFNTKSAWQLMADVTKYTNICICILKIACISNHRKERYTIGNVAILDSLFIFTCVSFLFSLWMAFYFVIVS